MVKGTSRLAAMLLATLLVSAPLTTEAAGTLKRTDHATAQRVSATIAVERQVLALLNADRARYGIRPLHISRVLRGVARAHSADMARRRYFAHLTPDGISPFQRMTCAGVRWHAAGENLGVASGYAPSRAARVINAQMMAEPPNQHNHRAVILDAGLHQVGIGVQLTSSGSIYITEDFTN